MYLDTMISMECIALVLLGSEDSVFMIDDQFRFYLLISKTILICPKHGKYPRHFLCLDVRFLKSSKSLCL